MRVVIAEDQGGTRDALVRAFRHLGVEVVGSAGTVQDVKTALLTESPDLVLLDLRMPSREGATRDTHAGIELGRWIRHRHPRTGILVFSQFPDLPLVEQVLELGGGVGYQLKESVADLPELVRCMKTVAAGGVSVDAELTTSLARNIATLKRLERFSPREREVIALLAEGRSTAAIAQRLHIAASAVEASLTSIYNKLGIDSAAGFSKRVLAVLKYLQGLRPLVEITELVERRPDVTVVRGRCLEGAVPVGVRFRRALGASAPLDAFLIQVSRDAELAEHLDSGQTGLLTLAVTIGDLHQGQTLTV